MSNTDSGVAVSRFYIAKMDCATEEQLIRNQLRSRPSVVGLEFDLLQRLLTVRHERDDAESIEASIASLGLEPKLLTESGSATPEIDDPLTWWQQWGTLTIAGVAALFSEVVAWNLESESAPVVIALALIALALGGREPLVKGWAALRTRTLNINLLMTIAVFGATLIGQWPEAAMVVVLFALAEKIEGLSMDRARNAIHALMELAPDTARVQDTSGVWEMIPAEDVDIGMIVRVRPGERIPVDGLVSAGQSAVDQAPITGESLPVDKAQGDPVFAGTICVHGTLDIEVTVGQGDTTLARIARTIREAQAQRAPTQRFVDQFARYYTPIVVVLALFMAIVPPLVFGSPVAASVYNALVLLVVACPCALVLSTPITVVSGLTAAARRGILIKGGTYLEQGREIRAIALDKTGTLTLGTPSVTDVIPLNGMRGSEILRLAASLNAHSGHPVAQAIVNAFPGELADLIPVSNFRAIPGRGAEGEIDGSVFFIGNHRLAEERATCSPSVEDDLLRLESEGKTSVVLGVDSEPYAVLAVSDTVRPESVEAIADLDRQGVRIIMLTGDNKTTARAVADRVGIEDARAELLPEDKLAAIDNLLGEFGVVAMVGDGVNDAPALARASVGFAMGAAGTDTALEIADVAIMDDDLRKLPQFLALSRSTSNILKQNIALSIGIKVVFFALALVGQATLWMAVFADVGTSLIVVANGLRLLRQGRA